MYSAVNVMGPKVDTIIIPLKEVFITLKDNIQYFKPNFQIDWWDYVRYVIKYLFDDQNKTGLQMTECRTILISHGFNEEQMTYIEHRVILMAVELVGEIQNFIRCLSKANMIIGFYWDIDRNFDLIITLHHR